MPRLFGVSLLLWSLAAVADSTITPAPPPTTPRLPEVLVRSLASYAQPRLRDVSARYHRRDKGWSVAAKSFDNVVKGRLVWTAPSSLAVDPQDDELRSEVVTPLDALDHLRHFPWRERRLEGGAAELVSTVDGVEATLLIDAAGRPTTLTLFNPAKKARVESTYTTEQRSGQRLLTRMRVSGELLPRPTEGGPPDVLETTWEYQQVAGLYTVRRYQSEAHLPITDHTVTVELDEIRVNRSAK